MYKDQIFFSKTLFNPRVQLGSGIGNFIGNFSSAPSISPEVLDPCRKKEEKKIKCHFRTDLNSSWLAYIMYLKEKRKEL